jgi:hypothetical protein
MSLPRRVNDIEAMSPGALRCNRHGRHYWEDGQWFQKPWNSRTVWETRLVCGNCHSVRIDRVVPGTFELLNREYDHADDYLPQFVWTHEDYVKETIRRSVEDQGGRLTSNGTAIGLSELKEAV